MKVSELIEKLNHIPDKDREVMVIDLNDRRPYPLEGLDFYLIDNFEEERLVLVTHKVRQQEILEGCELLQEDMVRRIRMLGLLSDYLAFEIENIHDEGHLRSLVELLLPPDKLVSENWTSIYKNLNARQNRIKTKKKGLKN
jgi:hypothetical protein